MGSEVDTYSTGPLEPTSVSPESPKLRINAIPLRKEDLSIAGPYCC